MADGTYSGDVCYVDGWHHSVDDVGDPGERLVLEDDGTYRFATDADTESWHDRKHRGYVLVDVGEMHKSVPVSSEEMDAIQKLLDERRGS